MSEKTVKVGVLGYLMAAILLLSVTALFSVPTAFFLMLFLGNLGIKIGFLGTLPGAIAIGTLKSRNKG